MQSNFTEKGSRRRFMWPALLGFLVLAVLAVACHFSPSSLAFHIKSMHTTDAEEYCLDTSASVIDKADFRAFLAQTIFGSGGHTLENWEDVDHNQNVGFVPIGGSCAGFSTWVDFRVEDNTAFPCDGPDFTNNKYSCVYWADDPACAGYDHCHRGKPVVTFKTTHVIGLADAGRHVINHELGHVFGLADPQVPYDDIGWDHCRADIFPLLGPVWIDSIMHAPDSYCDTEELGGIFRAWVRPYDETAAGALINQP